MRLADPWRAGVVIVWPPSRPWLACAVALVLLLAPSLTAAQLEELCRRSAARYDALLSFKRATKPQRVAETYVEVFTTKGADGEAQEVWRRMAEERSPLDRALEAHIATYHADLPAGERATLRADVTEQIRAMTVIRDLVLAFESATLTPEVAAKVMEKSWRKQRWDAPHPIEHYLEMILAGARAYKASNLDEEQATVRAAADAQAAVDRDRGVPRRAIASKGSACYKEALARYEAWLRAGAMAPLTEAEAAEASKIRGIDPSGTSRLTYYTQFKFGPRDYSLDRLRAWQIAAQGERATR
jgi:hypothetical protein